MIVTQNVHLLIPFILNSQNLVGSTLKLDMIDISQYSKEDAWAFKRGKTMSLYSLVWVINLPRVVMSRSNFYSSLIVYEVNILSMVNI